MEDIILASSKPWHVLNFKKLKKNKLFNWFYVATPQKLDAILKKISNPRYIFFLHWNWKVSSDIFQNHECICFHMTDLPYGRGGSPLQNLILNKKKKTKISAFKITEYMDRGPIYTKKQMSLNGRAEDIYKLAGDISLQIIDWIIKNKPSPYDQSGNATYFKRRKPKDSSMPKQGSLSDIYDHIRMLDAPTYPPAYIDHGKFKIEFSNSQILDDIIKSNVTIKLKNKKK